MDAYREYLVNQDRGPDASPLSNKQEDYKRGIAQRVHDFLNSDSWEVSEIGSGSIGDRVYKAVQKHVNLIGRFQVSSFDNSVKENGSAAEQLLFDFYHEHKEQECFDRICRMFGKKYDLVAYLYFIYDPNRYLPLRSSLFDETFKKLGIPLQTSGRCSWENYQKFLNTVAAVRNAMREYYQLEDVDLLDAHSFLWTLNQNVLNISKNETMTTEAAIAKEQRVEVGAVVTHKEYGEGTINKINDNKMYVDFDGKRRVFPYPDVFEKKYLKLVSLFDDGKSRRYHLRIIN